MKEMSSEDRQRIEKSAEDYWFEYSHESIVEGLRAITEANFKQAIRACQSDCTESLMSQIEYQNKEAKQSRNKIMELEFKLKEERSKVIDECTDMIQKYFDRADMDTPFLLHDMIKSLKSQ